VGRAPWTALELRRLLPHAEVILVDRDPEALKEVGKAGFKTLLDDVARPRIREYGGADLLYSIHPPAELRDPILDLASKVGAGILVKPLSEDAYLYGFPDPWRKVQAWAAILYLWSRV